RPDDAVAIGREWGRYLAQHEDQPADPIEAVRSTFDRLGFDPEVDGSTVCFGHCPFRELAEAYPDLVCSLHQGLCEGLVGTVEEFFPLDSRQPCTVVVGT